ncbi:S-type pyocin [Pseudomonas sp. NPDC089554]|uniref:S-type pyocin n=1 Tax=Pseudomonas sp. NPDC089554 TaxID=3390653 RepID=UPI003CFE9072
MAAPIPAHIAAKLAGRRFKTFSHFCTTLWMTIAEDPVLSQQFIPAQLNRIKKGWPPRAPFKDTFEGIRSYEICHLTPPELGGEVYDIDNMRIMSLMQYTLSSEISE